MKRITASQARKQWFQLLDEVVEGETVVIERKGRQVIISTKAETTPSEGHPDYSSLLQVPDDLNEWRWEWDPDEGLRLIESEHDREDET
jgi:antitoxin (DNA-binding transcriptional repressor) of toxin-antitoxin stability system